MPTRTQAPGQSNRWSREAVASADPLPPSPSRKIRFSGSAPPRSTARTEPSSTSSPQRPERRKTTRASAIRTVFLDSSRARSASRWARENSRSSAPYPAKNASPAVQITPDTHSARLPVGRPRGRRRSLRIRVQSAQINTPAKSDQTVMSESGRRCPVSAQTIPATMPVTVESTSTGGIILARMPRRSDLASQ